MQPFIPVHYGHPAAAVSAREPDAFLEARTGYKGWFSQIREYRSCRPAEKVPRNLDGSDTIRAGEKLSAGGCLGLSKRAEFTRRLKNET